MTASIAPDALVAWPVNDLVLLTKGIWLPNTRRKARLSERSLLGVPVQGVPLVELLVK